MAPLHIDRGMADILTGRADDVAICGSLGPRDRLRVDVVAQPLVDGMAQCAVAGHVPVDDAGDEHGFDELDPLAGLGPGGERARGAREGLDQALHALELGVVEPRPRLARVVELAVLVEAERERAETPGATAVAELPAA